jgi:hypothetical protein
MRNTGSKTEALSLPGQFEDGRFHACYKATTSVYPGNIAKGYDDAIQQRVLQDTANICAEKSRRRALQKAEDSHSKYGKKGEGCSK